MSKIIPSDPQNHPGTNDSEMPVKLIEIPEEDITPDLKRKIEASKRLPISTFHNL